MLDKAERSEEISAWTLGAAVPLALSGAVFILVDVFGRNDINDADQTAESGNFHIAPSVVFQPDDGNAVIGATVTW